MKHLPLLFIAGMFLTIILIAVVGGYSYKAGYNNADCKKEFPDNVGFMIHGEFFSGNSNYVTLEKINDKTNWDKNEYFDGIRWTNDKNHAMKVPEKDSCILKNLYFKFVK